MDERGVIRIVYRCTPPTTSWDCPAVRPLSSPARQLSRARIGSFRPPASTSPEIVQPAGVVTSSRSAAGWRPETCTMRADPSIVCTTSVSARVPRQPDVHAGVGHGFHHQIEIRRSAAAEGRDRVEVIFVRFDAPADTLEHLTRARQMRRRCVRTRADGRHAFADRAWRIRHRADPWIHVPSADSTCASGVPARIEMSSVSGRSPASLSGASAAAACAGLTQRTIRRRSRRATGCRARRGCQAPLTRDHRSPATWPRPMPVGAGARQLSAVP